MKVSPETAADITAFIRSGKDDTVRTYRRQAVQAFPFLFPLMISALSIRRAIDSGRSLREAAMRTTGLSKGSLRRVSSLPILSLEDTRAALDAFAQIAPDHIPGNAEDLHALVSLFPVIDFLHREFAMDPVPLWQSVGGKWQVTVDRLTATTGSADMGGVLAVIKTLRYLRERLSCLVLAAISHEADRHDTQLDVTNDLYALSLQLAGQILLENKGLTSIAELADMGERRRRLIDEAFSDGHGLSLDGHLLGDQEWVPLHDGPIEVDGYRITPLVNAEQLQAEGDAMSHCVGGYDASCKSGHSHIASVHRVADNEHIGTLELCMPWRDQEFAASKLTQNQFRGRDNCVPEEGARKAVEIYRRSLGQTIQVNSARLQRVLDLVNHERKKPEPHKHHALFQMIGFDFLSLDRLKPIWEAFAAPREVDGVQTSALLSKKWRKSSTTLVRNPVGLIAIRRLSPHAHAALIT